MGYLKERVAIVTGGSKGIGRAVCMRFAAEGAFVCVNYLNSEREALDVVQAVTDSGGKAMAFRADVSIKGDVESMVEAVMERWGDIHILVNNAGVAADAPGEHMKEEDFDRVVDVSLKGSFLCTQAVIPVMRRQRWGKIITVSAASALRGRKNGVNFCAAKAGVLSLTKCFARELAPDIQVNCLMPGFTETEEIIDRFGLDDPDTLAELIKGIPSGRLATPEEIASGALVLASSFSDQMTGQVLAINGGSYM